MWPLKYILPSVPPTFFTYLFLSFSFVSSQSKAFFCPLFHPLLKIMIYIFPIADKSSALFLFVLSHSTHCSVLLHCPCSVSSYKLFIHILSCHLLTPSHDEVVACSVFRSNAINWKILGYN